MSGATIAPYFPLRRIKIRGQVVASQANRVHIRMAPDRRFAPVCHHCGTKAAAVHSWTGRSVRDLDMAGTRVWLDCRYRKLYCAGCRRIVIEELDLFDPYLRITRRLAAYIHELCRWMTVRDVAGHLGLEMILKEKLKLLWRYRSRAWAAKALDQWCALARSLKQKSLCAFANMLQRHR